MSNWIAFFDELDRLFRDTARLLKDADGLMAQRGFHCAHSRKNQVGLETSGSIEAPGKWAPRWLARFYYEGETRHLAAFVAVFLCDEAGKGDWTRDPRVDEPLVVAGVLEGHQTTPLNWFYWNCKQWFWQPEARVDSGVVTVERSTVPQSQWRRIRTFALPLAAISDLRDLESKVVGPLAALTANA